MFLFFWRSATNILQKMNIKRCVISNILYKKPLNFRVVFRQETEKLQVERMQMNFVAPTSAGGQGLKATFEMKTRLPCYQVSFLHLTSSVLELDSCLLILQLHNDQ